MSERNGLPSFELIRHVNAGSTVYPPGGTYGPRIQQDWQIVLLHTGSMTVTVNETAYHLKAGHAILLLPGRHEFFEFSREQESWHRWIAIHYENVDCGKAMDLVDLPICLPITEEMNRLTDMMLALRNEHADSSGIMRSLGQAALQLSLSEGTRIQQLQKVHPSVIAVKRMIHERYKEELALEKMAQEAGVSPEHLIRLFNRFEEMPPIKYLWHYRVLRAVELLTHTGLTITEISERCGFKTTYHFARTIKQQTGNTPTQIRKAYWAG